MNLSSIIIAKDEEKNIKRCLESQQNVIDDIVVVVDSTSTDNTFNIASSFPNVNCEVSGWMGYGKTKNYAINKTKNDWVLWIDADEELTKELISELIEFKKNIPKNNSFFVARRAFFLGKWIKHSGWYPSYVVRLFNKKFAKFNEKSVHENLVVEGVSGYLKHDLNHYTDPNIEHYFNKFNKYTSFAARDVKVKGKKNALWDIIIRPVFLFVKMYIFKLGFLDGLHGLILAVFSSAYVFTKYSKLWELNREKNK